MADVSRFSLEGRALKLTTAADIDPHLAPLHDPSASTSLHSLSLQGNTIGPEAAATLAPLLASLTSLADANLADIFTARLLSEIPPALSSLLVALAKCPALTHINLNDNAFGLKTVQPLVDYIPAAIPLRVFLLNNNGLGPNAGAQVANALRDLAAKQGTDGLQTIVCGRNRLENGSMIAWAGAVKAHAGSLKNLKMIQNGIRSEGIQVLLRDGLAHATKLQLLDLQDNTFTKTGAQALADIVPGLTELTELGVGDCLLSNRGMVLLAQGLTKGGNKQLEVLKLGYNEIGAEGVAALVQAVEKGALPKLRRVELNGNVFSDDDESVDRLRGLLEDRKEQAGVEGDSDDWGLDELDDLEEPDEDDEDEGEDELRREGALKDADQEEAQNVAEKKDQDVDDLAEQLGKTAL